MRSLTHRLVVVVLLSELLLTLTVTAINLGYERSQRYQAFDVMLRGRAASILGAVEVDEDKEVPFLNSKTIDVPAADLYSVQLDSGEQLGHSANWVNLPPEPTQQRWTVSRFRLGHLRYRAISIKGFRNLDPENGPKRTVGVIVLYASSTLPVRQALVHAATFLFAANLIVLILSGVLAATFIRRGMGPLQELAAAARSITTSSWSFHPPQSARSVRELASLSSALETTLQGLERSFQQQQHFIHDAAHELKTAVTIIKSSLQLLVFKPRSAEEYRSGIETSLNDSMRMEELVQKMLTLANVEQQSSARPPLSASPTVASETIRNVIDQLRPVAELRSLTIQGHLSPHLTTPLSSDHWNTLATNLILNAIQHSTPDGQIVVSTEERPGEVIFTVADSGTGIPSDSIPYVFDRFYRGDPSRARSTGGTGLGLAICKAIVDSCAGQITIDSAPGKGTTVIITLPKPSNPA